MHVIIIIVTFAVLTLFEHIPVNSKFSSFNDSLNISEASNRDFSTFLIHHFATIPTTWMMVLVICFMSVNSVFLGISISCSPTKTTLFGAVCLIEKLIQTFTLAVILQSSKVKHSTFWYITVFYSLISPAAAILINTTGNDRRTGIFASVSSGFFLHIGFILWRSTFLMPFDWKKHELFIVCVLFFLGVCMEGASDYLG